MSTVPGGTNRKCSLPNRSKTRINEHRFIQYSGGIALSVITVGDLWTRAKRAKNGQRIHRAVGEFIELADVINIDQQVALRFGELRARMFHAGTPMPDMDALIADTALVHNLTLVTHNTTDFQNVEGLRIVD